MARGPSTSPSRQSRKSRAKKSPARAKRRAATAPAKVTRKATGARKAAKPTPKRATKPASKASKAKTATTATRKGTPAPPTRSPKAPQKKGAAANDAQSSMAGRITVENVNVPGYKNTVDATKYAAVRDVLVKVLPKRSPGLTQDEMLAAVQPKLQGDLAAKAMWWIKTVQLDLEAKKRMAREATKPLRWHLA